MSSAVPATTAPAAESTLEPGMADIIIRSRQTILDILDARGYDTSAYRNIAPAQLLVLAETNPRAMDIFVPKRAVTEGEENLAPSERAVVVHMLNDRIRTKLGGSFRPDLYGKAMDPTGANKINKEDDVIVIVNEPYDEKFDKASLEAWQQDKARLTFFHIKSVVVNPARHVLVPPHKKLSADAAKAAMERLHVTSKIQLPTIKHFDIQARVLGLVPGDIVEILRPSPTAGVARCLRACTA
jgi:DNA-directed RNA polymerase subunit H (RpoH/RPB5)